MIQGKHNGRRLAFSALVALVGLGFLVTMQGTTHSQNAPGGEAHNMRLVGWSDLQGRESLEVHVRSDDANGSWAYVGHSNNYWGEQMHMNPITGQMELNGTSILNVADPSNPELVWHIPNETSANSRHVGVVYDYEHDGSGRDYLVRSSDDGVNMKFQVFDITSRDSDPSQIRLVSEITGTPENSCGIGCGGPFIHRAHKGYWSEDSGYYYTSAGEPGFRSALIQVWDLTDPVDPKFVSRMWLPGQKRGELGYEGQYAHHPIVDEENNRVYAGFRRSGWAAAWDIANIVLPQLVWAVDTSPPGRGPHTISPIVYDAVPNFKEGALPRTYALVTDEAGGSADMRPCTSGVRTKAYMFDVTYETHPFPVETWQVPTENFCNKGGRFGPHQHAETRNGRINRFEDKLAWFAYFNAGVRVVDISNPYHLREVGYYIPEENENSHPMSQGQPTAIQINDVTVDHRGLGYATDRVGTGLFILEYTGPAAGATTD